MRKSAFDMNRYCLSACALSATELTGQRKIDVYQISRKLHVIGGEEMIASQKVLANTLFPEHDNGGKCVCIIAEDGIMLLRGDHGLSSVIRDTGSAICVKNSIKQLHEQLFEVLTPQYQFSKRTQSIAAIATIVPDMIAGTDRQSFAWLSCYWN